MGRRLTLPIPDHIHEELMNWTRWCWLGEWPHPMPPNHCGSLESQYRAPPEWDMDLAEMPQSYIRPNERNARKVQAVYEVLPEPEKSVLKAEYPGRHTSGRSKGKSVAATRIGLSVAGYDESLQTAVAKVAKVFDEVRA